MRFNQNGPYTSGWRDDTCTTHHNMQEDTSSPLTEILDGETKLMDVWQIQWLIWYFAILEDEFGRFVKIQGRSWWFTQHKFFSFVNSATRVNQINHDYVGKILSTKSFFFFLQNVVISVVVFVIMCMLQIFFMRNDIWTTVL